MKDVHRDSLNFHQVTPTSAYAVSESSDLTLSVMKLGRVLPLVARSVLGAVLPDIPHDEVDYNVVQNNGKRVPFYQISLLS